MLLLSTSLDCNTEKKLILDPLSPSKSSCHRLLVPTGSNPEVEDPVVVVVVEGIDEVVVVVVVAIGSVAPTRRLWIMMRCVWWIGTDQLSC